MEEIDLGLALGSTNRNSSGAGVNANLKVDMTFAASDPLSELVWSPHKGLSLKCAESDLADKRPFHLWDEGQSSKCLSISQSIGSKARGDEKIVDEDNLVNSPEGSRRPELGASDGHFHGESNRKMEEDEDTKDSEEDDLCSSQKVQIAESSKRNSGQDTLADDHNENSRIELNTASRVTKFPQVQVTSAAGEVKKNKTRIPLPAIPLKKLEFSAENDMTGKEAHSLGETNENSLPVERSPTSSRVRLYQEKGKQKALSDGDIYGQSSKDNSHESVESCNSARLFSKGIKRQNCDRELVIGGKRMKRHGSPSIIGPDSSFMNWISNMVKGLSESNKRERSSFAPALAFTNDAYGVKHPKKFMDNKIRDSANQNTGFQTMFQSMYCRKTKVENGQEKEDYFLEETKELEYLPTSCERKVDNSCKEIMVSNKKVNLSKPCTNPLASLWITRLYTQTPNLENRNQVTWKTPKDNLDNVFPMDQKSSEAKDVSEAMDSVFARRLDALRHIIPSKTRNYSTSSLTCFFCGKSGHDLRDCPEVTKTELEDLLVKISSISTVRESPSICIRCLNIDHWAISCPFVTSSTPRQSGKNASFYLTWNVKKSSRNKRSSSKEIRKSSSSNSENGSKYDGNFPLCNFVNAEKTSAPEDMCCVIKKLRLSRGNILRWMNSNVSLSNLNGFFLRLRLGKFEAGVGGTGYYVACIVGDGREHIGGRLSYSILVDIGGTKISVGSEYISNHDFLEGEIDDWWCRLLKAGGKIPSLDELNSKFKDRKSIDGFGKIVLAHFAAAASIGVISAAAVMHFRHRKTKTSSKDDEHNPLAPYLDRTESGRVGKIERFSHYLARQMGFEDENECPQLIKLGYEYLKRSNGVNDKIYEYFANEQNAEALYVKLVEEFERCILGYFAFHWSHAPHMISQACSYFNWLKNNLSSIFILVLSVNSEQKRLKEIVMAATRKQRFDKLTKDLKVTRLFSTLVEEMKAIGARTNDELNHSDVMVPVALSERSPVLLLMGGGMGAGKSTVLKDIMKESFWSGAVANAVIVEADAFKETDVIYRALSSRGHHQDMLQTAELVHQSSTDAASSLLVTALNEGRDVIMDGTLSWEPFVEQTIAMARNVHKHRYRMGDGYKVSEDGTITENYWVQIEEEREEAKIRKPYRIELVGVICDAYLAVVRGIRRAIHMGRAVRVQSQLKSHKRFANAFPKYCHNVDNARLYCTNSPGGPPMLIAWKDGDSHLLVDPDEIKCLTSVKDLNDEAESIYELYKDPDHISEDDSVWKDIVLVPTRPSLQLELKNTVKKIEIPVS
ncbi:hypothetical protein RD792_009989 [Penstemon davidsonii]|uniref:CCHC-type domain-containing protein n=1 Tax=Penstemon davidsonii TaxID=160366 RepID=A0ABR0D1E8_9LAMI|nr:hypothetical protein RD792_009989 [Penstemon davidsonii]